MKKRMMALALCAAMVLTSLTGCAGDKPDAEGALFTPGTYESEVDGHNDKIKLAVTVDENKILEVKILEHKETPGVSDPALNDIPAKIVEKQTVALDSIAGCTVTCEAVLAGAKSALLAAGATEEAITKAPEADAPVSKDPINKTADAVIVGAGGAGMSAAAEVIKAGGSVIIIDKMSSTGGNTILAGSAMNLANPEEQKKQEMSPAQLATIEGLLELPAKCDLMAEWQASVKADIEAYKAEGATYLYDSADLHKLQTYVDGDYVGNPEIINYYGDHVFEAFEWLTELGAEWKPGTTAAVGATWPRSHTPEQTWGSKGAAFVLPQQKYVEENGGEILLGYKAEELVQNDEGRVVGVKGTTTDGVPFELTANKGVLLATGGFGANVEMRQKYNKHWATLDETIPTSNGPQATGDGIVMAEAIGANLVGMEWIQMLPSARVSFTADIDNQIFVNKDAKRFIHEDGRRDELSKAILEQEDAAYWRICSSDLVDGVLGGMSITGQKIVDMVDDEKMYSGETLEELAGKLGIPADALVATVNEYNTYVENGGAGDPTGRAVYGKKIENGPFYALVGQVKVHHTMGGIEINTNTEVLDTEGNVIPGLYAAGEVTGGLHGANRLGGNAIGDIIVYGRTAGQQIMK